MKRVLRWCIYICLGLIALVAIAILCLDIIARSVAEKRLKAETGMDAQIGKMQVSLRSQTLHIENLKLINPPEFGGKTFVDMPELHVELDTDALRNNKLHLRLVRLNLAEVHVVENAAGKKNTDVFEKTGNSNKSNGTNTTSQPQIEFAGIDKLVVSLGRAQFTSELHPRKNQDRDLGIKNREFSGIKNEKDLKAVGMTLALQAGFNSLMEGILTNPKDLIKSGSAAGKELGEGLKGLFKGKK